MNLVLLGVGVGIFTLLFIIFIIFMIRRSQQAAAAPTPAPGTPSPTGAPGTAPAPTTPGAKQTTTITDCGYASKTRGWYDVSGLGVRNDYCRWVGPSEADAYFSCALAGSTNQYTPSGQFTDDTLTHDALGVGDVCYQGQCRSGFYQSAVANPLGLLACRDAPICLGGIVFDASCNCACTQRPA